MKTCPEAQTRNPSQGAIWLALCALAFGLFGCGVSEADNSTASWKTMKVTATGFTVAEDETKKGNVGLTAFGDQVEPGDKALAVSRDLIRQGMTHGTKVRIDGLPGEYTVRDKMNRRWRKKIDILFAKKKSARKWGKQTVEIVYQPPASD